MEKVLEVQGAIGTLKLGFVRFCPIPFHDNGFLYLYLDTLQECFYLALS